MHMQPMPSSRPMDRHPYTPPTEVRRLEATARRGARIPALQVAGDVALLTRPAVAVVGSRKATADACETAWRLAAELAESGFVVVSGLAEGIDAAAHRGTMAAPGGRTIAVIGTPLERVYPKRHASLQEAIYRKHLLVSPFAEGTQTRRGHFPARNRVMARLAYATVLVAAGERSGTQHQVREAIRVGRSVLVHARLVGKVEWVADLVDRGLATPWATTTQMLAVAHAAVAAVVSRRPLPGNSARNPGVPECSASVMDAGGVRG
jgi:DNA processing protein